MVGLGFQNLLDPTYSSQQFPLPINNISKNVFVPISHFLLNMLEIVLGFGSGKVFSVDCGGLA